MLIKEQTVVKNVNYIDLYTCFFPKATLNFTLYFDNYFEGYTPLLPVLLSVTWRSCSRRWSHSGPSSPPRSKMTSSVVQEDSCNRRDDGCGSHQCGPLMKPPTTHFKWEQSLPAGCQVCCRPVCCVNMSKAEHSASTCLWIIKCNSSHYRNSEITLSELKTEI